MNSDHKDCPQCSRDVVSMVVCMLHNFVINPYISGPHHAPEFALHALYKAYYGDNELRDMLRELARKLLIIFPNADENVCEREPIKEKQ